MYSGAIFDVMRAIIVTETVLPDRPTDIFFVLVSLHTRFFLWLS